MSKNYQKIFLFIRYDDCEVSKLYYSEVTQRVITFIESNLTEEIQLDTFPSVRVTWFNVYKRLKRLSNIKKSNYKRKEASK